MSATLVDTTEKRTIPIFSAEWANPAVYNSVNKYGVLGVLEIKENDGRAEHAITYHTWPQLFSKLVLSSNWDNALFAFFQDKNEYSDPKPPFPDYGIGDILFDKYVENKENLPKTDGMSKEEIFGVCKKNIDTTLMWLEYQLYALAEHVPMIKELGNQNYELPEMPAEIEPQN